MKNRKCYGCQTPVEAEGELEDQCILCDNCGDIMTGLSWTNWVEFDRLYQQQLAKADRVCTECSESLGDCVCDQLPDEYIEEEVR